MIRRRYSNTKVDKAGKVLVSVASVEERSWALEVLQNWRGAHEHPLNVLRAEIADKAYNIFPSAIVAHRLKRVPSILAKLRPPSKMCLSRIQDIGG